jgi:hypothetical protein
MLAAQPKVRLAEEVGSSRLLTIWALQTSEKPPDPQDVRDHKSARDEQHANYAKPRMTHSQPGRQKADKDEEDPQRAGNRAVPIERAQGVGAFNNRGLRNRGHESREKLENSIVFAAVATLPSESRMVCVIRSKHGESMTVGTTENEKLADCE